MRMQIWNSAQISRCCSPMWLEDRENDLFTSSMDLARANIVESSTNTPGGIPSRDCNDVPILRQQRRRVFLIIQLSVQDLQYIGWLSSAIEPRRANVRSHLSFVRYNRRSQMSSYSKAPCAFRFIVEIYRWLSWKKKWQTDFSCRSKHGRNFQCHASI